MITASKLSFGLKFMQLRPDCAPHSVAYILELLQVPHYAGCQFYRAENRGSFWDSQGNHVKNVSFGLRSCNFSALSEF